MTITTAQMRGARGLLNWSQSELSKRTGISTTSIGNIEAGNTQPRESTLKQIRQAFENSGIEFIGTEGMRLRNDMTYTLQGDDALDRLLDDISGTLTEMDEEVLIDGAVESKTPVHILNRTFEMRKRGIRFRHLIKEGDRKLRNSPSEYKWLPESSFVNQVIFIYGNKVAIASKIEGKIFVHRDPHLYAFFKNRFNMLWNQFDNPDRLELGNDTVNV